MNKEFNRIVGHKIREGRKASQLSQAALAIQADVSRETVANIELGRQNLTLLQAIKICRCLDLNIKSLEEQLDDAAPTIDDELQADINEILES